MNLTLPVMAFGNLTLPIIVVGILAATAVIVFIIWIATSEKTISGNDSGIKKENK